MIFSFSVLQGGIQVAFQIVGGVWVGTIDTPPSDRCIIRFGLDVAATERDMVLGDMFGENVRIVRCGEIGSADHVISLVREHGATHVDWNPVNNRHLVANDVLDALEDMRIPVVFPLFLGGRFAGYKEWDEPEKRKKGKKGRRL